MLLEKITNNISSSGVQQVARATIKTSPKIFNFFADQTYANKPKAIARELVANAVDSHVMAGKGDTPVEVWLPTIFDPVFRVRDHGLGMAHEFMMNEFMCYADGSTKDGSNVAIGGFGIGSKSPFAYVDQYTVSSCQDGIESVYSVFKDEEGIPAIGLLGQRPTTDPNGVEVSFPVKPEDFETFETAAFEALRYFEPLPLIKNATEGKFTPPEYVATGRTWGMRPEAGALGIIMGGVRYPVNADNLTYKFPSESAARKLLKYGLDIRVPIGTCSVALSREALSYDDSTIEALSVACANVIDEVAENMANMFDAYDSPWDAAVALDKEVGEYASGARAEFLLEHAKWHGEKLTRNLPHPMLGTHIAWDKVVHRCAGYRIRDIGARDSRKSRRAKSDDGIKVIGSAKFEPPNGQYGFEPAKISCIIIDDLPPTPKYKAIAKIKEFANEDGGRILVIRPDEDQSISAAAIIEGFGSPPPEQVVLTSSLPEPYVEKRQKLNNGEVRPRVRMFTYDGREWAWKHGREKLNLNPGQFGLSGVDEIPYDDQPETGILVVMENFRYPREVHDAMKTQLIDWDELHFVNIGDAKKLKGWTSFADEFERRKKEALARYPELAQSLALHHEPALYDFYQLFRRNPGVDFSSRKPFGQIFNLFKHYVEPLDAEQHRLAPYVTPKLPKGVKPDELVEKFNTKQWRAKLLMNSIAAHYPLEGQSLELFQENL